MPNFWFTGALWGSCIAPTDDLTRISGHWAHLACRKQIMRVRNSQCFATGLDALNSGASSLWEDLVCVCLYKYEHPHTDYHHVLSQMVCWPVVIGRYGAWGHSKTFIHIHTDRCLSANGCLCVLVEIVRIEYQKSLLEISGSKEQHIQSTYLFQINNDCDDVLADSGLVPHVSGNRQIDGYFCLYEAITVILLTDYRDVWQCQKIFILVWPH